MDTWNMVEPIRIPRPKLAGRELLVKTPLPDYDDPPKLDQHGRSSHTSSSHHRKSSHVSDKKDKS